MEVGSPWDPRQSGFDSQLIRAKLTKSHSQFGIHGNRVSRMLRSRIHFAFPRQAFSEADHLFTWIADYQARLSLINCGNRYS